MPVETTARAPVPPLVLKLASEPTPAVRLVSREPSTAGSLALALSCTTLLAAVPKVMPRLVRAPAAVVAPVPPSVRGMVATAVMAVVPAPFT